MECKQNKSYIYNEETFLCIVFISRCFLPPSFGLDDIPFKYVQEERRGTVSIIISSGTGDHPDVTQEMRENWHRNIYFSVFQKISKYSIFHMLFLNQVFNCHCLDWRLERARIFFYTFMFFIYLKNIFHAFSYLYNSVLYFLSYLSLAD